MRKRERTFSLCLPFLPYPFKKKPGGLLSSISYFSIFLFRSYLPDRKRWPVRVCVCWLVQHTHLTCDSVRQLGSGLVISCVPPLRSLTMTNSHNNKTQFFFFFFHRISSERSRSSPMSSPLPSPSSLFLPHLYYSPTRDREMLQSEALVKSTRLVTYKIKNDPLIKKENKGLRSAYTFRVAVTRRIEKKVDCLVFFFLFL